MIFSEYRRQFVFQFVVEFFHGGFGVIQQHGMVFPVCIAALTAHGPRL